MSIRFDTMDALKVAHATLEFKIGVGGIKSVTTGLIPALAKKGVNPAVITPFYDVYNGFYDANNIQKITTITHIYKGREFTSDIWRACSYVVDEQPIYHYLIKPTASSPVSRIFDIGNEEDLYRSFHHSEAQNRVEYFNSALAAMIRMPNDYIPEFDIFHGHTWHSGIAGCLIKEFENLTPYQSLLQTETRPLKKIPYVVSTIHMLLKGQDGGLYNKQSVTNFLTSIGLPLDFSNKFPNYKNYIREDHLKQIFLTLAYADQVNTVSKGLIQEAIHINGQGLDDLIKSLFYYNRLNGITNGINYNDWDPTLAENLQEHAINIDTFSQDKQRIKRHLAEHFPNLDPDKKWFIFIGRFAKEKGVDYLEDLLSAVKRVNGNLIILGSHVVTMIKDGKVVPRYQELIDTIRDDNDTVVIDDYNIQKKYGKKFRAAADCAVSLSENEACGLVPMELMTCGALAVVPNIQGLPDTVKSLRENPNGTGFLYDGNPEHRAASLQAAIIDAVNFLNAKADSNTLNDFIIHLHTKAKEFDWNSTPSIEYFKTYKNLYKRELLTSDKIRDNSKPLPMISAFNNKLNGKKVIPAKNPKMKIWQIGFNKAGSTTLFKFFANNKVLSLHYGLKDKPIADSMYANFLKGRPMVEGEFDRFTAYFDMEDIYAEEPLYIGPQFFKELDEQYPGSKFILNTRDKESWIKSRLRHIDPMKQIKYIDVICEKYNMTVNEVINKWSREWDEHHAAVLEYFKDRPEDLLVFDIDVDGPIKICEFFKDDFVLDPALYEVYNRTDHSRPTVMPG